MNQTSNIAFFCDDYYFLVALRYIFTEKGDFFIHIDSREKIYSCISNVNKCDVIIIAIENANYLDPIFESIEKKNSIMIFIINTPLYDEIITSNRFLNKKSSSIFIVSKYIHPEKLFSALSNLKNDNLKYIRYPYVNLTKKEKDILNLTISGYSIKNLSMLSRLSEKTVYAHKSNALRKFGLVRKNPLQFIKYGYFFSYF